MSKANRGVPSGAADMAAARAPEPANGPAVGAAPPHYWPLMEIYHQARAALYAGILRDLDLPRGARLLDAGSGDGFYSRMLIRELGPSGSVVALDNNFALLALAPGTERAIHPCQGDLDCLAFEAGSFDAIWLCRTMHSSQDPVGRVCGLARLLRPGGTMIVVENDSAHHPILSLDPEFEHRLRDARLRYERSRASDGCVARFSAARYLPSWLRQAGLSAISMHTYVSEDLAPMDEPVETYWRLFLDWQLTCLEHWLSGGDLDALQRAIDPASSEYVLTRPDFYCLELTTVARAVQPRAV